MALVAGLAVTAVTAIPASANTMKFTDLNNSYAAQAIQSLADANIISGYGDGQFHPKATMTRDEFAVVLTKALGLTPDAAAASKFTDVEPFARQYVGALVDAGITSGISANLYGAKNPITRQDMVVMFVHGMKQDQFAKSLNLSSPFADSDQIAPFAQPSVALAANLGLVNGMTDSNGQFIFDPTAKATREAVASVTNTFLNNLNSTYKAKLDMLTNVSTLLDNVETAMKNVDSYEATSTISDVVPNQDSLNVKLMTDITKKPLALHASGTIDMTGPDAAAMSMFGSASGNESKTNVDLSLVGDRIYAGVTINPTATSTPKWYMATLPDSIMTVLQTGDFQQITQDLQSQLPPGILPQMMPSGQANMISTFLTKDITMTSNADGSVTLSGTISPLVDPQMADFGSVPPQKYTMIVDTQNHMQSLTITSTSTNGEQRNETWSFSKYDQVSAIKAPDMTETAPTTTAPAAGTTTTNN